MSHLMIFYDEIHVFFMQYCTIQKYYKNHLWYLTCVTNMQDATHDSQI